MTKRARDDREAPYRKSASWYDALYSWKNYRAEAAAVHRLIRRYGSARGRRLLDVACGTGRHLAYLRKWYRVTGLDASAPMLVQARRTLGPHVSLVHGDMRSFKLGQEFDAVTCLFSAFAYNLTVPDLVRTFTRIREHLAPGGVAVVEGWFSSSEWHDPSLHLLTIDRPELKVVRVVRSGREGRCSTMECHHLVAELHGPTRTFVERHVQRLYEPEQVLRAMRRAGLRARFLRRGLTRHRGLFIGTRPPAGGRRRAVPKGR